ncbi:MAG: hypothetical protein NT062_26775 [Proteobacteria bacterium]|nr:hypothetical protein [Pseudomonadota bacterium]
MRAAMWATWVTWGALVACANPATRSDAGVDSVVQPTSLPTLLSQTGFDASARAYTPRHVLWSDAAVKRRWISLPPGATIDTTDFDRWVFPVGTKWWKEFALDGKRLETRVIWRVADTGDRERDTLFGTYLWNDAETDATLAVDGGENLRGTQHDAPPASLCLRCHLGEPGHALGFSAIQLPDLVDLPLSSPPAPGATFAAPNAALGYLHANCGHCHNPQGSAWANSTMVLRLGATETAAAATQIYATTVGVPLQTWVGHGYTNRIVAGQADQSAIPFRMSERTPTMQMPPIATELPDDEGLALVRTWIDSL